MKKIIRTVLILFIVLCLLVPAVSAVVGNNDKEHKTVEKESNIENVNPMINLIKKPSQMDGIKLALSDRSSTLEPVITTTLPGEYPMNNGASTRADRDIWLKKVEITARPMSKVGIGLVGKVTSFTATFQNNDSAGDVEIRMKTTRQVLDPDTESHWQLPVEYKDKKIVSSAGGGAEGTAEFDWTPTVSCWYTVNFTAFEIGDPVDNNNRRYFQSYVGLYGTECNVSEVFKNPVGFQIADVFNDQDTPGHSTPKAWSHSNPQTHICPQGNNTLDYPTIDQTDFDQRYLILSLCFFSGTLPTGDSHKMLERYDNNAWRLGAEISAAEATAAGVNDGWFAWFSQNQQGQSYPGMILNNYGQNVDTRICTGITGGAAKGFYFDDLIIWGLMNYTDVGDFEQILSTGLLMENGDTNIVDSDGREGIIDQKVDPDEEIEFTLKLTNTGTAPITRVDFDIIDKPDGWTGDNYDEPASLTFTAQNMFDVAETETFTFTMTPPEDARASVDYSEDEDDMKFNPYVITFSATATGVGDPTPSPETDMEEFSIEAIVNEKPAIEVTVDTDTMTGAQGAQLEYEITIENTGNCNLTEEIKGEIEITIENMPPGLWTATPSERSLKIDYEDSVDIAVTVTIPLTETAGDYDVDIGITIEEYDIEETIILKATVEQVFGLKLDLKDDDKYEVNPTNEKQREELVEFEISNTGNGEDIAKIVVESEDDLYDDWVDLKVETFELKPKGDPMGGHEEDFAVTFNIPEDAAAGEVTFTVKAVSENDEETETDEFEISFKINRPNLEVDSIITSEPESPVLGEKTQISVRIFNKGLEDANGFTVWLAIKENTDGGKVEQLDPLSADEFTLVDFVNVNQPLQQETGFKDIAFEHTFLKVGEYDLLVLVDHEFARSISFDQVNFWDINDHDGNITEMVEDEFNWVSSVVEVVAPDLEFKKSGEITVTTDDGLETIVLNDDSNFDIPTNADHNKVYKISIPVKNDGKYNAKDIEVRVIITYFDDEGLEVEELNEIFDIDSTIKGGETGSVTFEWIPGEWNTNYIIALELDPDNNIPEADEDNNEWTLNEEFITSKKPKPKEEPGFEVAFLFIALIIVGAAFYRKRK